MPLFDFEPVYAPPAGSPGPYLAPGYFAPGYFFPGYWGGAAAATAGADAPRMRDRQILRLIADILEATGQFDDVITATQDATGSWTSESARLASLSFASPPRETPYKSEGGVVIQQHTRQFAVLISVRDADPDAAFDEADRLYAVAANAIGADRSLGGVLAPWLTSFEGGEPERTNGNETRLVINGTFGYHVRPTMRDDTA